jgi:Gpi18-like mannosyltransferase
MTVATWFVATRLIIFAIGVVGAGSFVNQRTQTVLDNTSALNPENVWHKWDATWYEEVAAFGYGRDLDTAHGQATAGYFPLYPFTVKGLMTLAPSVSFFWTAAIFSNLCTLAALLLLAYGLIERDDTARRTLAVTLLSAGSFYLSIPYAESLFLLLVVAVLVATKRRQYELAGLLAGLSATTRVHGLALIAVPVVACWLDRAMISRTRVARAAASVAIFTVPFVIYMAHLNQVQGSWLAFVNRQELWGNPSPYPFQALAGFIHFPTRITAWLHGGFWFLYAGLLVRYWRRIPLGEVLFCLGVFVISTQQEAFHGIYRYVVPLVPLSIAIADDRREVRDGVLAFNIGFGVLMILAFVTYNRLTV